MICHTVIALNSDSIESPILSSTFDRFARKLQLQVLIYSLYIFLFTSGLEVVYSFFPPTIFMHVNSQFGQNGVQGNFGDTFQRRMLIGSTAPTCTFNECRACKYRCRAEQIPVNDNDPLHSAYRYKCVCHR